MPPRHGLRLMVPSSMSAVDDSWATTEIFVRGAAAGASAVASSALTTVLRASGEGVGADVDQPILTLNTPRALVRLERLVVQGAIAVLQGSLEVANCDFHLPPSDAGRRRALRAPYFRPHYLGPDQPQHQPGLAWPQRTTQHRQLTDDDVNDVNNSAIKVDGGAVSLRGVTFDGFRARAVTMLSGTLTADNCTLQNYDSADVGGAMVRCDAAIEPTQRLATHCVAYSSASQDETVLACRRRLCRLAACPREARPEVPSS